MSTQGSQTWQKLWEWHVKNRILVLGGLMKGPATPLPVGEPPTPRRRPWLLHLGASALSPARPSLASVSPLLYSHFPFLPLFKVKRKVICSCGSSFREVVTQGPLEASSTVRESPAQHHFRADNSDTTVPAKGTWCVRHFSGGSRILYGRSLA